MPSFYQVATSCIVALSGAVLGVGAALVEAPSVENFHRRSMAKATVLGKYVYIDGGLITQFEDGQLKGRGQNQGMYIRLIREGGWFFFLFSIKNLIFFLLKKKLKKNFQFE